MNQGRGEYFLYQNKSLQNDTGRCLFRVPVVLERKKKSLEILVSSVKSCS
jgi:hypothetical protein